MPLGKLEVEVYLGSQPRLGIIYMTEQGKYIAPGEVSSMVKVEIHKDPSDSRYPHSFFTEILCRKPIEVGERLSKAFHAGDIDAQNEILNLAARNIEEFRAAADLIAGVIGLRFHRQFVIERISEHIFLKKDERDWSPQITGPWMEILEDVSLKAVGADLLSRHLLAVSKAPPEAQASAASTFRWLLSAWSETNPISKFLALFIPIEIVLEGYGEDPEEERTREIAYQRIQELISSQAGPDAQQLLEFFENIMRNYRPSLNSRFEQLARQAKIDGWETDVKAFRRFNAMRNGLLHRGEDNIRLVTTVHPEEVKKENRHLEDIAERYVSWVFFRDHRVYPSKWRTPRRTSTTRDEEQDRG